MRSPIKFMDKVIIPLVRNNPFISKSLRERLARHITISEKIISKKMANGKILRLHHNKLNDVTYSLFWKFGYENETIDIYLKKCKIAAVIIDVGANIGYYSLLAALVNKEAEI